jgi:hypothetical protein
MSDERIRAVLVDASGKTRDVVLTHRARAVRIPQAVPVEEPEFADKGALPDGRVVYVHTAFEGAEVFSTATIYGKALRNGTKAFVDDMRAEMDAAMIRNVEALDGIASPIVVLSIREQDDAGDTVRREMYGVARRRTRALA